MNIKKRSIAFILICLLALLLAACRADEPAGETEEIFLPIITDPDTSEEAYPVEEAYPMGEAFVPMDESAYPIKEADLALLLITWRLAAYAEDGVEQAPPIKTLTFNGDGSYTMTTGSEQETGSWTTILYAAESTLILNTDNGETRAYQILDLNENALNLRTQRGELQIEEGYLPAD